MPEGNKDFVSQSSFLGHMLDIRSLIGDRQGCSISDAFFRKFLDSRTPLSRILLELRGDNMEGYPNLLKNCTAAVELNWDNRKIRVLWGIREIKDVLVQLSVQPWISIPRQNAYEIKAPGKAPKRQ